MSWTFDERAHAGLEHLTPEHVAAYDAKAQVDPAPDVQLLQRLGLTHDHLLIDLGAGTGEFALYAARVCRRVIAVDVSPLMLDVIRGKAHARGLTNVECVEAGFLTYQPSGELANVVYSRNALHHLPDFWKVEALRRVHAMLTPGGVFRLRDLVYSFRPQEAQDRIDAWLRGAPSTAAQGFPRGELEAHVREEFSTYGWLLEVMLERTGFVVHTANYSASGVFADYICHKL